MSLSENLFCRLEILIKSKNHNNIYGISSETFNGSINFAYRKTNHRRENTFFLHFGLPSRQSSDPIMMPDNRTQDKEDEKKRKHVEIPINLLLLLFDRNRPT